MTFKAAKRTGGRMGVVNLVGGWIASERLKRAVKHDPVLQAALIRSHAVLDEVQLRQHLSAETIQKLSEGLWERVQRICTAQDRFKEMRFLLSDVTLDFARFQVLVIDPTPASDPTGMRGGLVTGELKPIVRQIVQADEDMKAMWSLEPNASLGEVWNLVLLSYWRTYWWSETINACRKALGDAPRDHDWYAGFIYAACVKAEYDLRQQAGLPSNIPGPDADIRALEYYSFVNIVCGGDRTPAETWKREFNNPSDDAFERLCSLRL